MIRQSLVRRFRHQRKVETNPLSLQLSLFSLPGQFIIFLGFAPERDEPCCRTEVSPNHLSWYAFCALLKISMEVMIGLARADYEKLVNDVPIGSCAYGVLHRSPRQLHRWGKKNPSQYA